MRIVTYFDANSWPEYSSHFYEKNPIVLYHPEIDPVYQKEIKKVFSECTSCDTNSFYALYNDFASSFLKEGTDYLFVAPKLFSLVAEDVSLKKDALCNMAKVLDDDYTINMSKCVNNLKDRVSVISELDETKNKLGGLLDSSFLLGTSDFWTGFIGFQKYLVSTGYIRPVGSLSYSNLILNLFYKNTNSFSIELR